MAGKKSVRVKAHNRRPPSKKASGGPGWGVLLLGGVAAAYLLKLPPFRG